jgi:hypothetical protein
MLHTTGTNSTKKIRLPVTLNLYLKNQNNLLERVKSTFEGRQGHTCF